MSVSEIREDFLSRLTSEFEDTLPEIREAILSSAADFAKRSVVDMNRWYELAAAGELSKAELAWLIQARMDVAEMAALKDAGLALVRIDELRRKIARTLISAMTDATVL